MRAYNSIYTGGWSLSEIGNFSCCALYDFCNAFPSLLHVWLFLVLECLGLPPCLMQVIQWMYTDVCAYSSGCGDGSFLFQVLCGVKTGCPLSSLLFLLAINPIVDLFIYLSDGIKLSATGVCADDFGSAFKALHVLRTQASIFKCASKVAGLELKGSKCVVFFTGVVVVDYAVRQAVKQWFRCNIPEFVDFEVANSGKYLGWHLGLDATPKSFAEPLRKYGERVSEICDGLAPVTVSLLRYNQRAVPVLSFVSQFSGFPKDVNIQSREHHALHKILRLPPLSFSRKLMFNLGTFTVVEPIPLDAYCKAVMFRFAMSEKDYLLQLRSDVRDFIGDHNTLRSFSLSAVPQGLLDSAPICIYIYIYIYSKIFPKTKFKNNPTIVFEKMVGLPFKKVENYQNLRYSNINK